MKYWAYIDNEIKGPFDREELPAVAGYSAETLLCPESTVDGEPQEWQFASALFADSSAMPAQPDEAAQAYEPAAEGAQSQPSLRELEQAYAEAVSPPAAEAPQAASAPETAADVSQAAVSPEASAPREEPAQTPETVSSPQAVADVPEDAAVCEPAAQQESQADLAGSISSLSDAAKASDSQCIPAQEPQAAAFTGGSADIPAAIASLDSLVQAPQASAPSAAQAAEVPAAAAPQPSPEAKPADAAPPPEKAAPLSAQPLSFESASSAVSRPQPSSAGTPASSWPREFARPQLESAAQALSPEGAHGEALASMNTSTGLEQGLSKGGLIIESSADILGVEISKATPLPLHSSPYGGPNFAGHGSPYPARPAAPAASVSLAETTEIKSRLEQLSRNVNSIGQILVDSRHTQKQADAAATAPSGASDAEAARKLDRLLGELASFKNEFGIALSGFQNANKDIPVRISAILEAISILSADRSAPQQVYPTAPADAKPQTQRRMPEASLRPASPVPAVAQPGSPDEPSQKELNMTIGGTGEPFFNVLKRYLKGLFKTIGMTLVIIAAAAACFGVILWQGYVPDSFNPLKNPAIVKSVSAYLPGLRGPQKPQQPAAPAPAPAAAVSPQQAADAQRSAELLAFVKSYEIKPGVTLESAITAAAPAVAASSADWKAQAVSGSLYAVSVTVPPAGANGYKVSYFFDYDAEKHTVVPTNSEAQNLFITAGGAGAAPAPASAQQSGRASPQSVPPRQGNAAPPAANFASPFSPAPAAPKPAPSAKDGVSAPASAGALSAAQPFSPVEGAVPEGKPPAKKRKPAKKAVAPRRAAAKPAPKLKPVPRTDEGDEIIEEIIEE
ncbi:MAG: hypothetical protein PHP45_01100 [Elusimicrobiales bacterium]|nr:hypothetical protein [Elusimicrobiales bacterium]